MELNELNISDTVRATVQTSINNYQRFARLRLTVDKVVEGHAFCTAHQYESAVNGRDLTFAEIEERAENTFAPLRDAGLVPLITVLTVEDKNPAKPIHVHRELAPDYPGTARKVFRQAVPRILFQIPIAKVEAIIVGHLAEDDGLPIDVVEKKLRNAQEWLKREGFRGRAPVTT